MKTVNLEEILANAIGISVDYLLFKNEVQIVSPSEALEAMREACNQTVDLCNENAQLKVTGSISDDDFDVEVDRELILNTKSQII